MENSYTDVFKSVSIPVTLKGTNYLLWSRLVKTALGGRGLWEYVVDGKDTKKTILGEDGKEVVAAAERGGKRSQKDLMVLSRPGRSGTRWHSDRVFRVFGFSGLRF